MTAPKNSLGLRAGLLSLLIFVAIVGIWQIATLPTAATGPAMDPEYAKLVGAAAATGTKASMPTPADIGLKDASTVIWYAIFMPSKTPRAIVEKFHDAAAKVLATPAMKAKMKQLAVDPLPLSPAEVDQLVVKELAANEKLIKAAGIK